MRFLSAEQTSRGSAPHQAAVGDSFVNLLGNASVRVLMLVFLFTTAAVHEAFTLSALTGTVVWSHLRTGIWMLQNHAVPRSGLFSQYPDLPWMARSWGFDVLLAAAYSLMGLRALPVLLMVFKAALAIVFVLLARGSWQNFWAPVLLAAFVQYAIPGPQLEPALCSILLCAIEVALLFHARRTGNVRLLLWLPPLFTIWANLDSQFIYGLLVLVLFLAAVVAEEICRHYAVLWFTGQEPAMPLGMTAVLTAASLLAPLLTPYAYDAYGAALKDFGPSALLAYLPELNAVGFRRPQDYALLSLAMMAFFSLGRRCLRNLFQLLLMIVTVMLSFPAQRHSWLAAVASVAVIGDALQSKHGDDPGQEGTRLWKLQDLATAWLVFLALWVAVISHIPPSRDALLARVGRTLPVGACDYIRQNHLLGPLFNAYEWGGFLIWYLPDYAVTIDARDDLYGVEISLRYFKLIHAEIPLSRDVSFVYARTILLQRNSPMAVALSASARFKVVYQDDLATVLVPQNE